MKKLIELLQTLHVGINAFYPLMASVLGVILVLRATHWILLGKRLTLASEQIFSRQLVMLLLILISVLVVVLALPVGESSRNQIIGLIGLLISAIFALSSSTIFANLMAGILLRVTRPFQIGDFISVDKFFGRVTESGLFDTEIQAENRELIAIPNTYIITHPVSTVLGSGAIVSAQLSLGYDVHHSQVRPHLKAAALLSGLEDPFVHILELGDYSVSYRVSGKLTEVKALITARSNLYASVLDVLHDHGIEIVSPTFMNQRPLKDSERFIPANEDKKGSTVVSVAEEIVFDKAEQAEQVDKEKRLLQDNIQLLEASLKQAVGEEKNHIKTTIDLEKTRLKALAETGINEEETTSK